MSSLSNSYNNDDVLTIIKTNKLRNVIKYISIEEQKKKEQQGDLSSNIIVQPAHNEETSHCPRNIFVVSYNYFKDINTLLQVYSKERK